MLCRRLGLFAPGCGCSSAPTRSKHPPKYTRKLSHRPPPPSSTRTPIKRAGAGELAAPASCPGFRIDANGDKRLSADELQKRVEAYAALTSGSVTVGCIVSVDNSPLADATVTFVPEACMGGALKTATAKTNVAGHCDEFTIDGKTYRGVAAGLYKIQVTKDGVPFPQSSTPRRCSAGRSTPTPGSAR